MASERPDIDRLQSKLRSFIYGEWGSIGDERARPLIAALDELVALARSAFVWKTIADGLAESREHQRERAEAAEERVAELEAALREVKSTLAFEHDGEWYTVGPGGGLVRKAIPVIDAALAGDGGGA